MLRAGGGRSARDTGRVVARSVQTGAVWFRRLVDIAFAIAVVLGVIVLAIVILGELS